MAFDPTPAQKAAIELKNTDLLVSAAAGSGKTATLIERILRRITDPKDPCSVTELLVVTFTKDSASDLIAKLSRKLTEALAANPGDRHLSTQLLKVRSADVSTIHSFCMRVLKPNFQMLGLPSDFRVGDEGEVKMLRAREMRRTLDEFYEADPDTLDFSFTAVADCLSHIKNEDALPEELLRLYDRLTAYPEGIGRLLRISSVAEGTDFFDTVYGDVLRRMILRFVDYYTAVFTDAVSYFAATAPFDTKYLPAFDEDLRYLRELRRDVLLGYEATARRVTTASFASLSNVSKAKKTEESDFFVLERTKYKEYITKKLQKDYMAATLASIDAATKGTSALCYGIYRILSAFDRSFGEAKRSLGICDYGDLERYTYRLLVGEDGKPTPLAAEVGARYREIYVDEYQDTNELQDAIFRAIGNGHNRFMVGDIKQSIYRFRGADSRVFASYREIFPTYRPGMAQTGKGLCVFMSDNFRCDRSVIDFSNAISRFMFSATDGVPFTKDDELKFSKSGASKEEPVDVYLFERNDDADEDAECVEEARFIAGEIRRILKEEAKEDGKPYKPSDFAVLCRSPKHLAPELTRRLMAYGIPVQAEISEKFFDRPEILLVLSLLNVIDNPLRDTYLAGALCSPVFGFVMDELIEIRRTESAALTLYDALCAYEGELSPKISEFLATLGRWRELARAESSERLIRYLYEDTGLLFHSEGGEEVRRNLLRLYHYAKTFEGSSYKGLYRFLEYVDSIRDESVQSASAESGGVTVTTIHKSKGMEFAVCFLSDLARPFNEKAAKETVVYDEALGFTTKLLGTGGVAHVNTVHRMCALRSTLDAERLENMRVLYVAMTRAKTKLILTAALKKRDETVELCRGESVYADAHWFYDRSGNFIRWILGGIFKEKPTCARMFFGDGEGTVTGEVPLYGGASAAKETDPHENIEAQDAAPPVGGALPAAEAAGDREAAEGRAALVRRLQARFGYTYPHAHLETLPAKLTVSKLSPTTLDTWAEKDNHPPVEEPVGADALWVTDPEEETQAYEDLLAPPAFLAGEKKATAAEAGTATHVFMQFCDFACLKQNGPREELDRLVKEKFLPEDMASLVKLSHVEKFLRSPLFAEMEAAASLKREFRFNLLLPADHFTADPVRKKHLVGEQILVQGVIDCLLFYPDGRYVLIDYKTDYLTQEERENPDLAAAKLRARHGHQLAYYGLACEKMLGRKPEKILIYSLPLGDSVVL